MVAVTGTQGGERTSLGEASVFATTPGTQPSTVFVSLAVPAAQAQEVADTVAQQRLRLVLLPGGQG
jgi:hypothetical protein